MNWPLRASTSGVSLSFLIAVFLFLFAFPCGRSGLAYLASRNLEALCPSAQRFKQRRVRARHEGLKVQAHDFVEQRRTPFLVEMRGDLVEQQQRRAAHGGEEP